MAYKILIVDDSKLARMAVAKALNSLRPDWTRIEATNADEALTLARQSDINVALLDFNMPGRDGLSLAAEIRDLDPRIALALISANVQQEILDRAAKVGAAFLAKPLTEAALGAFLAKAETQLESTS
ncbi:response regulator [Phenylobacterium sp.]|uniref:response regulator transcription factor n=1 Tax=Phenylobacterium sp. TaxID=1871053 RepID=UPI00121D2B9E|nr:response regulator [Phenylobacterium sp.]THD62578.1 MAG: response regulator [Phenylobacterium sp.]